MLYKLLLLLPLLFGCSHSPTSHSRHQQYSSIERRELNINKKPQLNSSPYYVLLLVDAPHLDYSDVKSLFKTVAKHPANGSKSSDVGHAWIYLNGIVDGREITIEGGHSGEIDERQPKYFRGVFEAAEKGEENPIAYLWKDRSDGFFQKGAGHHRPTAAIKIDLTEQQFHTIYHLIDPKNYNYQRYNLIDNQCATFVVEVADAAGIDLSSWVSIAIEQTIYFKKGIITLWSDPDYSKLSLITPDTLEKKMTEVVEKGGAEDVLKCYLKKHPMTIRKKIKSYWETCYKFPARISRYLTL